MSAKPKSEVFLVAVVRYFENGSAKFLLKPEYVLAETEDVARNSALLSAAEAIKAENAPDYVMASLEVLVARPFRR